MPVGGGHSMWITVARPAAVAAAAALARVDYSVATKLSERAAEVVAYADAHHCWWLAPLAVDALRRLDEAGSCLICAVAWLVHHAA